MKTKLTYKFRLSKKDVESGLKAHIDELAEQRKLTDEIKTALTLLAQLKSGNTELLNALFPNVCTPPPKPPNTDEINRRLANIEAKLEQRPMHQDSDIPDTRGYGIPAMKQSGSGIGKLANRVIEMPTFADDDAVGDTIVLNKSTVSSTGANFIASFAKLGF